MDELVDLPPDEVARELGSAAEDEIVPEVTTIPEWVKLPPDAKLPEGRHVVYVLFRPEMTDTPKKGERQCVMWNLTEADEKLAIKRTRGDGIRMIDELTKQMIRVVDGVKADWTGVTGPGSVTQFWDDIGGKCRQQLKNIYSKNHTFSAEEAIDFFTNCIAVRTAGI